MSLEILSAVWDLDLDRNEKDVLEVLAWHANADGVCWPSKARIMYRTGLSESTVKRTLGSLKKAGLVTVGAHAEGGRGKTPIYTVRPEKGVKKPPFNEWKKGVQDEREEKGVTDEKGVREERKGGQNSVKGVRAVNPEPSVRTAIEEPSESVEVFANAHTSSGKPQSADSETQQEQTVVPLEKYVTDRIFVAARNAGYRLPNESYPYHLGRAKDMLAKDSPTDSEIEDLPAAFVRLFEVRGKADACSALVELRRQQGRERVIAESEKPRNEPTHPQSEAARAAREKPRRAAWYSAFLGGSEAEWQRRIDGGATHAELMGETDAA